MNEKDKAKVFRGENADADDGSPACNCRCGCSCADMNQYAADNTANQAYRTPVSAG